MILDTILDQILVFIVLIAILVLFATGKWRYDVVAVFALLFVAITGVLPAENFFAGFSHPAVIIITSLFIISRTLVNSGVVDAISRKFVVLDRHPVLQLFFLSVFVAVASAFINNIGALVFAMPLAIHMARKSNVSPAMFLLPLAFASHIGGFLTLIGTPRNIIVSSFRAEATGEGFALFDFAYVGAFLFVFSVIFLAFMGWRLIPDRKGTSSKKELFDIKDYVTEIKVGPDTKYLGKYIAELKDESKQEFSILAFIRKGERTTNPPEFQALEEGDSLIIKAEPEVLTEVVEVNKFILAGNKAVEKNVTTSDELSTQEAVVPHDSYMEGKKWGKLSLRLRYGVNLLAVSREGEQIKKSIEDIKFKKGDVLLLHGRTESIEDSISALGLLPLENRKLSLGRPYKLFAPLSVFVAAIVITAFGWFPVELIFLTAALIMVLFNFISLDEAYKSIHWPTIVLVGGMLTLGIAFQESGFADTLSHFLLTLADYAGPMLLLGGIMVICMVLSDFVNASGTAVLMSPVAILVADGIGASIDPFLMVVAIGSASAFLTPYGHESNTLVMGPGGYKFKDYIKMGLPLEILILAMSLPLVAYFWPLY